VSICAKLCLTIVDEPLEIGRRVGAHAYCGFVSICLSTSVALRLIPRI
jgi:hypothetical protein